MSRIICGMPRIEDFSGTVEGMNRSRKIKYNKIKRRFTNSIMAIETKANVGVFGQQSTEIQLDSVKEYQWENSWLRATTTTTRDRGKEKRGAREKSHSQKEISRIVAQNK